MYKKVPQFAKNFSHTIYSGCKINLFLDILGIRTDGFHELETLFFPITSYTDVITISNSDTAGLSIEFSGNNNSAITHIDTQNNTLTKAYNLYTQETGFSPQLHVHVQKNIPSGAGLGGGSANAAALLLFLQQLYPQHKQKKLSPQNLIALATKIGADVPFFLHNAPSLAFGIGEQLFPIAKEKLQYLQGKVLLIVTPPLLIATPEAFKLWDTYTPHTMVCTNFTCFKQQNHWILRNSFEQCLLKKYPVLLTIKNTLLTLGAHAAVLSGSGSSLFGVFPDKHSAEKALQNFTKRNYTTMLQEVI